MAETTRVLIEISNSVINWWWWQQLQSDLVCLPHWLEFYEPYSWLVTYRPPPPGAPAAGSTLLPRSIHRIKARSFSCPHRSPYLRESLPFKIKHMIIRCSWDRSGRFGPLPPSWSLWPSSVRHCQLLFQPRRAVRVRNVCCHPHDSIHLLFNDCLWSVRIYFGSEDKINTWNYFWVHK